MSENIDVKEQTASEPLNVDQSKLALLLTAVEYGYKTCENGYSLQHALKEAREIFTRDNH